MAFGLGLIIISVVVRICSNVGVCYGIGVGSSLLLVLSLILRSGSYMDFTSSLFLFSPSS